MSLSRTAAEGLAHNILQIAAALEAGGVRSFVSLQGPDRADLMGSLPEQAAMSVPLHLSLDMLRTGLPQIGWPVLVSHDPAQNPSVAVVLGGIPGHLSHDRLADTLQDLAFLEDIAAAHRRSGPVESTTYAIGTGANNPGDRIATITAPSPREAVLKLAAVIVPGLAQAPEVVLPVELAGITMRNLHDWQVHPVQDLWRWAKDEIRISIERAAEPLVDPEPEF
ncbi:hypothetical protein LAZ40_09695 [Cereibacter sphaeroides]|uniref:hypothetical protein n=1 Tax=Cereibacter sphaeroides TaxID=1063 RepID=UPI001F343109|nr:hypothetical protein [Cereibacter sphaeroides]MCE6959323.1 hypothetical protein [Cereibacter sphaeroides]MCE6972915.1 hypothetical protein [Cereibacter sphaeroides]